MGEIKKLTFMEVMKKTAEKRGDAPALKAKVDGEWKTTSWKDYYAQVRTAARAFMKLGLKPGGGVTIVGKNCPQWLIGNNGAIFAGGVATGIYITSTPEQCRYVAGHCGAVITIVEDKEQLAKFKKIRDKLPDLKAIVMMSGSDSDDMVHSWEDLEKLAKDVSDKELDERIKAQKPDDLAELIYTSGTTGDPKGVMLSHDNLMFTAKTVIDMVGANEDDVMLSYLPLSHIAEQIVSLHGPIAMGALSCFAESLEKLGENLNEIHPTIFLGVPRVWEKIQAKMVAAGSKNPPLKKKIAAWARKKGLKGGYAEQKGESKPMFYGLAKKLVFSKVRDKLGMDRCRMFFTSAAPISKDTLEFFLSLGIPIFEIYGQSECTGPGTVSSPGHYRTALVGRAMPGTELKIADDGEILFRGRHVFLGYYKHEEATKEALDPEGWLHTGDIGEIDDDGYLKITDRKKDLIITSGGENIAPQLLEGMVKAIPVVANAVVIGDKRKYLTALLTLDEEKLADEIAAAGSEAKDLASAASCEKFREYIQKQLDEVNASLARVQTIKKFTILPVDFTIEGGELTHTMKVKRKIVNQKYAKDIENLYS